MCRNQRATVECLNVKVYLRAVQIFWGDNLEERASMRLISSGAHPRTERTKQRLSQIPFLVLPQSWIEFKMVGRLAHLDVLIEDTTHLASELF